jgi:shikimate dehydrogenase
MSSSADIRSTGPRAGVIGWPIAHSRSPLIHGHWLKTLGLAGSYERIPVPPEEIGTFLKAVPASGLAGCNVTVPHKEAAFASADRLDDIALAIGAVNTLWIEDGLVLATNTDGPGFLANLDDRLPGWDASPRLALVLGAGGAARAVIWGLLARGYSVRIANRTLARAEDLARRFGPETSAHTLDDAAGLAVDCDIIVNTTTLGMKGEGAIPLDFARLRETTVVTDIVYTPLMTPFLIAAAARGLRHADGLGMLLHQAVVGFEKWFGARPRVTPELRNLILADLGQPANPASSSSEPEKTAP